MTDLLGVDDWARESNRIAHEKGWYGDDGRVERNAGEVVALMHSELSEALEEWRIGRMETEIRPDGKPLGFYTELAGCVIRIMDTFAEAGVSLERELRINTDYNRTRPYRHGGKRA